MNQSTEQKIDCVVRVVTPENIEFEYLLAGPFQRLPAFLIDFVVRMACFFALLIVGALIGVPLAGGLGIVATWVLGFIGFFVLSWLYGTLMEAQFNGRTIGKILLGLRVISTDGRPINGSQAALRNLLRMSDLMPPLSLSLFIPEAPAADIIPTFFVGLVAMTLTTRMQRIGDLAAGTMVVWDGRRGVSTNLQPEDARAFALAEYIPPTFQISRTLARAVGLYMERRHFLSPQRRQEIAHNLAQPLFEQFDLRPDTSADLLLCALYVRIYHSEQQRSSKLDLLRSHSFPTRPTLGHAHALGGSSLSGSAISSSAVGGNVQQSGGPHAEVGHPVASGAGVAENVPPGSSASGHLAPTRVAARPVGEHAAPEIIQARAVEPRRSSLEAMPPSQIAPGAHVATGAQIAPGAQGNEASPTPLPTDRRDAAP